MLDLENIKYEENYHLLGNEVRLEGSTNETQIDLYESLIVESLFHRANSRVDTILNEDKLIPIIKSLLNWLRRSEFYTSPASTKYHEAFNGGLLHHSLQVYNKMIELHQIPSFNQVDIGSATLVALTHDWCKIGKYESYTKNVKNPDTKQWEEQLAYKYADKYMGLGHGPQSLMMVSQFCTTGLTSLTFDEMAAIRWHMYTYDVTSYDIDDLNKCGNQIPLVKLIQFADQLAICN